MKFGITIEIDLEANSKSALIQKVSDSLEGHFRDKDYGSDIENLYVGFICQRPMPDFESFFKERKPKYVSSQSVELHDGGRQVIRNAFSYDVRLNAESYEQFVRAPEAEALALLADSLIESLSNFDALPKKVRGFDVEAFKLEVVNHLRVFQVQ